MFSSADDDGDGTANEDCVAADVGEQLDQYHESHNAPVPYPTMHHFGIEMVHRTCRQIRNISIVAMSTSLLTQWGMVTYLCAFITVTS